MGGQLVLSSASTGAAEAELTLTIHFDQTNGTYRALHGVNKGPIAAGGTIDLTERHRELGIPHTRLHDCLWPHPDVVDIHSIFRVATADPERPESYDFALTDEYLTAVHKTGSQMIYRLGESIEHMRTKRFVHPPEDPEKWAAICVGIIRHYTEGWANGFRYGIPYWEIWNEPENRPAMWTGTDEEFLRLYATAAKIIKKQFPKLKIGGPGFGHTGTIENGEFKASAFLRTFLQHCRANGVPLDFFSWHCYTSDAIELIVRARGIRKLLDADGFTQTESHLNEWNYLPGNSWDAFGKNASSEARREFYTRGQASEGAAFALAALLKLQDAPVDVANFFHGEIGGFGLFDEFGGETDVSRAFKVFNETLRMTPARLRVAEENRGGIIVGASRNAKGTRATVLLANPTVERRSMQVLIENLPADLQRGRLEVFVAKRVEPSEVQFSRGGIRLDVEPQSFSLLRIGN